MEKPKWSSPMTEEQKRTYRREYGLWYKENRARVSSLSIRKWRERNPDKVKAYRAVYVAKRNGTLKPKPCRRCGNVKAEAHHDDYSKPLKVIWLCKQHHEERHTYLDRKANQK